MHWEYTGFIIPLILVIELVRRLLAKRPSHIKNSDKEKEGTMHMQETHIGRPRKRVRITPPTPPISPKRVRLEL